MTVLLTGGTGNLGRHLLPHLLRTGRPVRVLSRREQPPAPGVSFVVGDLLEPATIPQALDGVRLLVHLAGGPQGDDEATENLMRAASSSGVSHVVFISVIGADRVPIGYFRRKAAAEAAVIGSGVPFSVLRTAQFHDLLRPVVRGLTRSPVVPVPSLRLEPVDVVEVAARLAGLALGEPTGRVPDLAGPEVLSFAQLVRQYLDGRRRALLPVRMPGGAGGAYRSGANLAGPSADRGTLTWSDAVSEPPVLSPAVPRRR